MKVKHSHLGKKLKNFIKDHCKRLRVRQTEREYNYCSQEYVKRRAERVGFHTVIKPMHVFKKVYGKYGTHVIANMIIPVGATIFLDEWGYETNQSSSFHGRKMRATEAYVHSLVTMKSQEVITEARSGYDASFKYCVGDTVKPKFKFSKEDDVCGSGIHVFVNLADALSW